MSQFVNYQKRSLTLPSGCKNLIDVLTLPRQQPKGNIPACGFPSLDIKEDRVPTAGLAQVRRYVSMLLQSRGELFTVSVTAHNFKFPVTLYRIKRDQTVAIMVVTNETRQERAIRTFFEQQGLEAIFDQVETSDARRGLAYPLPFDVARVTSLTTELLRSVYGLSAEAGLNFRYYEMETAL